MILIAKYPSYLCFVTLLLTGFITSCASFTGFRNQLGNKKLSTAKQTRHMAKGPEVVESSSHPKTPSKNTLADDSLPVTEVFTENDTSLSGSPTESDLNSLWQRLLRYAQNVTSTGQLFQANLSDGDEEIIDHLISIDPLQRKAKEQAILFLALMEHSVVEYNYQTKSQQEKEELEALAKEDEDDHSSEEIVIEGKEVLPLLMKEYRIKLGNELQNNSLLQHPTIFHMVFLTLHHVEAPQTFISSFVNHHKAKAEAWSAYYATILKFEGADDITQEDQSSEAYTSVTESINQLNDTDSRDTNFTSGEFAESDRLLSEAKRLHSRKLFPEALRTLAEIPKRSPHYDQAQKLTLVFSDDAVNHLRKKASELYQAHLNVNSLEKKIDYLDQSEEKLLRALNTYPTSIKWEGKLRKNLTAVQNRREKLRTQIDK
ncbi:MAG: hypothetical protein OXC40_03295 [Proteobacteria bacterium]|nr:hypothetical protein [Pseudomonadota bacterium]